MRPEVCSDTIIERSWSARVSIRAPICRSEQALLADLRATMACTTPLPHQGRSSARHLCHKVSWLTLRLELARKPRASEQLIALRNHRYQVAADQPALGPAGHIQ